MKHLSYSTILLLFISIHSCIDTCKSIEKCNFIPSIKSFGDEIHYFLHVLDGDTIFIKVLKEDLVSGDGFDHRDSVFMYPEVYQGNKLIYMSKENSMFYLKKKDIITKNEGMSYYILLRKIDVPQADKYVIIGINEKGNFSSTALSKYCEDIDKDGLIEVGGFPLIEGYYESDSGYYSPAHIYELGDSIVFDSITSKTITLTRYEEFLGFETLYVPVKLNAKYIKQLTTQ
jgi:hypothetical protein